MHNIRLNTKLISSLGSVLFMHTADMMVATSIASTTWYSIMQNPENITIQQLLSIANGLHIPVRRFFSADKPDVIGQRDDYVTEPYQPCQYDTTVLQAVINNKSATWQQAAKAAGMSRDNLRKSMLAVRRTPVTRFLTVCGALGIDPFSILIDPNAEPSTKKGRRTAVKGSLRTEISILRENLRNLSSQVESLTEKYEQLLRGHENPAQRIDQTPDNGMSDEP